MKPDAPVTSAGFTPLPESPREHPNAIGEGRVDHQRGRRLEAAMRHAMIAARIAVAGAVLFPGCFGHEGFEGLVVPVCDEVAGALPALHVVGGIAPRGA